MKKTVVLLLLLSLITGTLGAVQAEEKPELRVLTEYSTIDANADPTAALLEQLTGYKVVYVALPNEERLPKLNAILASREPYDIMILSPDSFANTVHLGAFMPLDELLAQAGQAVLQGTNPSLWTSATVDGAILGIPYRLSVENYHSGLRVRTDILEKAGVKELPTTPETLYDALIKVRDEAGTIPLTGAATGAGVIVSEIASAFGLYNDWIVTEDRIRHRAMAPGAKDYVAYMNKLYTEKLIDTEWAQNSGAVAREKFLSGAAAINRVYWWEEPSASETLLSNFPDATYAYLPPLTGEYGHGMSINRSADKITVIPKVAEHPEAAMDWINIKVSTAELFREFVIGTEGTHYSIVGENEYQPINPAFTDEKNFASEFLTSTIAKDYDIYWSQTRVRKNEKLYAEFLKMQENVKSSPIYYDPTSFMSPNDEFISLAPTVNTFVYDTFLQMIVGTRSLDEWDSFIEEFKQTGGDELEAIVNEWWDQHKDDLSGMISR